MVSAFELYRAPGISTEEGEKVVVGDKIVDLPERTSSMETTKSTVIKGTRKRRRAEPSAPVEQTILVDEQGKALSAYESYAIEKTGGKMTTATGETVIVQADVPSRAEVATQVAKVRSVREARMYQRGMVRAEEPKSKLQRTGAQAKAAFLAGAGIKTTDPAGSLISERVRSERGATFTERAGFAVGGVARIGFQAAAVAAPVKVLRGAEAAAYASSAGAFFKTSTGAFALFGTQAVAITQASKAGTEAYASTVAKASGIPKAEFKEIVRAGYRGQTGGLLKPEERRTTFMTAATAEARRRGYYTSQEAVSRYYSTRKQKFIYDALLLGATSEAVGRASIAAGSAGKTYTSTRAVKGLVRPRLFGAGAIEGATTYYVERTSKFEPTPLLPKVSLPKGVDVRQSAQTRKLVSETPLRFDPGITGSAALGGASAVIIGTPIATAGVTGQKLKGGFYSAAGYALDPTEYPSDLLRDVTERGLKGAPTPVISAVPGVVPTSTFRGSTPGITPTPSQAFTVTQAPKSSTFTGAPFVAPTPTPTPVTPMGITPVTVPESTIKGRSRARTRVTPAPVVPTPSETFTAVSSETFTPVPVPSEVPPTVPPTVPSESFTSTFITSRTTVSAPVSVTTFNFPIPPVIPFKRGGGFRFPKRARIYRRKGGYTPSAGALVLGLKAKKKTKTYRTGLGLRPVLR